MLMLADTTIVAIWSIVAGIAALAIFFKVINWFEEGGVRSSSSPSSFKLRGVLDTQTFLTVHTTGETFEDVCILGYTDASSVKGAVPWELNGMVILGHRNGARSIITAKRIKQIDVPAEVRETPA